MLPASSKAGGVLFGAPDVCLTPAPPAPPVPVPYPNTAQLASAQNVVLNVLIENREAVVIGSMVPNSAGDNAGVNGGVVSGVVMSVAQPKLGSSKVYFGGRKAVYLTSLSAHNGTNANMPMGMQIAPSQVKVFVMP